MKDHSFDSSEDGNRGLASSVSAAYNAWEQVDPVIHHAIAYTYTNKYGKPAWI